MIMNYVRPGGPRIVQCEQANVRWPGNKCCNNDACDWPGYPDFRAFGFSAQCRKRPLAFDSLRKELQTKRPIAFTWRYSDPAEHMLVIVGYAVTATRRWLYINDPLQQVSYATYEAYSGSRGGPAHGRDYYRIVDTAQQPSPVRTSSPDACVEDAGPPSYSTMRKILPVTPSVLQPRASVGSKDENEKGDKSDASRALADDLSSLDSGTRDGMLQPQILMMPLGVRKLDVEDSLAADVWYARMDSLARYKPGIMPVSNVIEATSERAYALLTKHTVIATGSIVRDHEGKWHPASLGPPDLAAAITRERHAFSQGTNAAGKGEVIVIRTPPPFGAEFVGRWIGDSLWLTPSRPSDRFGWLPERRVLADSVFRLLGDAARRIEAHRVRISITPPATRLAR